MGQLYGGRWEGVEGDLGQGGQSRVLTVIDRRREFEAPCALKRILNPRRDTRFRNEVEAVESLKHPNVIPLLDHSALDPSASEPSKLYLVMPIATGGDLSRHAAKFEGDLPRVLDIAMQVAEALNAAHQAKIVHRDVKPENVLLSGSGDHVWVSDFGICLIDDGRPRATPGDEVVGPALFMAPELEGGDNLAVTPAVDVYSLGKLIFFLFSGGVRVPRERISENSYASWLAAPGAVGLRLLLTQMICPLHMRIATMDVVLQRLRHLRTPPAARGLSEAGLVFHNTAQSKLADSQRLAQERAEARSQAQSVLKAAVAQLSEIVDDQIHAGADALHIEGAIKAWVQRLDAVPSIKVGPRIIQVSGVHELLYQPGASPTARIWALRFFVHERPGSGSKVGLMAELQMRESNGQLVLRCSAWLKRTGGSNQTFEITYAGPTVLEVAPEHVAEVEGQIRDFVRNAVSSVPALAEIGYSQFMVASMAGRAPRR